MQLVGITGSTSMTDKQYQVKSGIREAYRRGVLTIAQIERLHAIGFFPEVNHHNRSVVCRETGENFHSVADAAEWCRVSESTIYRSINEGYSAGGYHWDYEHVGGDVVASTKCKPSRAKAIFCIETEDVFASITEAANAYGVSQGYMSDCVSHGKALKGRLHFRLLEKVSDDTKVKLGPKYKKYKKLRQIVNLQTGEVFDSVNAASEATGFSTGSFYCALNSKTRTLGGCRWMYVEDGMLLSGERGEADDI